MDRYSRGEMMADWWDATKDGYSFTGKAMRYMGQPLREWKAQEETRDVRGGERQVKRGIRRTVGAVVGIIGTISYFVNGYKPSEEGARFPVKPLYPTAQIVGTNQPTTPLPALIADRSAPDGFHELPFFELQVH